VEEPAGPVGQLHVSPAKQLLTSTISIRQTAQLLIDFKYLFKSINASQLFPTSKQAHWDSSLPLLGQSATTRHTASKLHEDERNIEQLWQNECGVTCLTDIRQIRCL
jgi:hypothetical protein